MFRHRFCLISSLVISGLMCLNPAPTFAGMGGGPAIVERAAAERIDVLSFFLMGFLVCGFLFQLLWNYLRQDFPALPRLTYGKALGLLSLWGFLFILVLTMISGARELMTPGAWSRTGVTYELRNR